MANMGIYLWRRSKVCCKRMLAHAEHAGPVYELYFIAIELCIPPTAAISGTSPLQIMASFCPMRVKDKISRAKKIFDYMNAVCLGHDRSGT